MVETDILGKKRGCLYDLIQLLSCLSSKDFKNGMKWTTKHDNLVFQTSAFLGEHKEWLKVVALQWMPLIEVHVCGLDIIKRLLDFLSLSCLQLTHCCAAHLTVIREKATKVNSSALCHDIVRIFDYSTVHMISSSFISIFFSSDNFGTTSWATRYRYQATYMPYM